MLLERTFDIGFARGGGNRHGDEKLPRPAPFRQGLAKSPGFLYEAANTEFNCSPGATAPV